MPDRQQNRRYCNKALEHDHHSAAIIIIMIGKDSSQHVVFPEQPHHHAPPPPLNQIFGQLQNIIICHFFRLQNFFCPGFKRLIFKSGTFPASLALRMIMWHVYYYQLIFLPSRHAMRNLHFQICTILLGRHVFFIMKKKEQHSSIHDLLLMQGLFLVTEMLRTPARCKWLQFDPDLHAKLLSL